MTDGKEYYFTTTLLPGGYLYNMSTSDGAFTDFTITYPGPSVIQNDFAPELTNPGVSPTLGNNETTFTFTVTYSDDDGNLPVAINLTVNGTTLNMVASDPGDLDPTNGKSYHLETTLILQGTYEYFMNCSDGARVNSTQVLLGPTVIGNKEPQLENLTVTPSMGNDLDLFTFSVNYSDPDGDMPTSINITINGSIHAMTEQDAGDVDTTDGKIFAYSTILSAFGMYEFNTSCSDGNYVVHSITAQGPEVIDSRNPPTLSAPVVNPISGFINQVFNYTVVYTDGDGNLPSSILIIIDGVQVFPMVETASSDVDTTDGKQYSYSGSLSSTGNHGFTINCSDGLYTASTGVIGGPIVLENDYAPQLLNPTVTPSIGTNETLYNFTVNYMEQENQAPAYINITVNGSTHVMTPVDPGDMDFTDGVLYNFTTTFLTFGYRTFTISCSDGLFTNSTVMQGGPRVVNDFHPPSFQSPVLTPAIGNTGTVFMFQIMLVDPDNTLPNSMDITIGGLTAPMIEAVPTDHDTEDGKIYYYESTMPSLGNYSWQVNATGYLSSNQTAMLQGPEVRPFYGMPQISLLSPSYGAVEHKEVVFFSWDSLEAGVPTVYRWQLSLSPDFSEIALEQANIPEVTGITSFNKDLSSIGNGEFYWRVRAEHGSFSSNWTSPQLLTIDAGRSGTFWEEYSLYIIIAGIAIGAVGAIGGSVAARKKRKAKAKESLDTTKKRHPDVSRPGGPAKPGAIAGKATPGSKKVLIGKGESGKAQAPMTAAELEELRKTENEVVKFEERKICVVHKGPIAGANYLCPSCGTFYCLRCARSLEKNGENCWMCGAKLDIDGEMQGKQDTTPGEKNLPSSRQFYCTNCNKHFDIHEPDFQKWYSCPDCKERLIYLKQCPHCGQKMSIHKEYHEKYKGQVITCTRCKRNLILS
ncbi:hypothetical protein GF325_15490 [Candidatus Bathyarchaeota archaeon]|nr:hypothetical protein [Candidatus Bathyarchaeota archaeon]